MCIQRLLDESHCLVYVLIERLLFVKTICEVAPEFLKLKPVYTKIWLYTGAAEILYWYIMWPKDKICTSRLVQWIQGVRKMIGFFNLIQWRVVREPQGGSSQRPRCR